MPMTSSKVRDTVTKTPVTSSTHQRAATATTRTMPIARASMNAAFVTDQGSIRVT